VILHKWTHYIERVFSRSDSIGGGHADGDKVDMRVAMSEGLGNAFSAMILDDPDYRDVSGPQQRRGFFSDVSRTKHRVQGWYSEASVQSIIYNFYAGNNGKNFSDIFNVISSAGYAANAAMISIYVFANELRAILPGHAKDFNNLLREQNIEITNAFGAGEVNSGGYAGSLPVYKLLPIDNSAVNLCSTNRFGAYNKLAVSQFLVLDIVSPGAYQVSVQHTGDGSDNADPDIYLYRHGKLADYAEGAMIGQESLTRFLTSDIYVLELVDERAKYNEYIGEITACFDVRAQRLN
jgi:hypothetical protein